MSTTEQCVHTLYIFRKSKGGSQFQVSRDVRLFRKIYQSSQRRQKDTRHGKGGSLEDNRPTKKKNEDSRRKRTTTKDTREEREIRTRKRRETNNEVISWSSFSSTCILSFDSLLSLSDPETTKFVIRGFVISSSSLLIRTSS